METFDINIDEIYIEIYTNIVSTDKSEQNNTNKVIFDRSMLYIPPVEGYIKPNITLNQYPYFTDEYLYPEDVLNKMIYYQDRVNFFFNKRLFNKIITENISEKKDEKPENDNLSIEDKITHRNIKIMIEYLFPTRPSVRNFTTTYKTRILKTIQLKPFKVFPWETYLYSYLKLNDGKTYTISKVDWVNDFISHPHYNGIIQIYRKFRKWVNKQIVNTNDEKILKKEINEKKNKEHTDKAIEDIEKIRKKEFNDIDNKINKLKVSITPPENPSNKKTKIETDVKNVIQKFNNLLTKYDSELKKYNYNGNKFMNVPKITSIPEKYANFVNEIQDGNNIFGIIQQIVIGVTVKKDKYHLGKQLTNTQWQNIKFNDFEIYKIIQKYDKKIKQHEITLIDIIGIFKGAITEYEKYLNEYEKKNQEYEIEKQELDENIQKLEDKKEIITNKYDTEINQLNAPSTELQNLDERLNCLKDIFKLNAADLKNKYTNIFTYSSNSEIFTEYQKFKIELDENVERGGGIKYSSSNPNIQRLFDDKFNSENTVNLYNTLDNIITKYFETKSLKNKTKNIFTSIKDYLYVGILSKSKKNTIILNIQLSTTIYKDTDSYIPSCKTTSEKLGETLEQFIYGNMGNIMSDIKPFISSNLFSQNENNQQTYTQPASNDVNLRNQFSEIIDRMKTVPKFNKKYKEIQKWVESEDINITNIDLYNLISQNKDITILINNYFIKNAGKIEGSDNFLFNLIKIKPKLKSKIEENNIKLDNQIKRIENSEKQKLLQENYKNKILLLILEIIEDIIKSRRQQQGGKKNYSKKIRRNKINLRKTKRSRWGK